MSQRHADNWSHPGHYLVDPYTRTWSPNGHGHGHEWPTATPLCNVNRPSHSEIQLFQNLTMKNPWSRSCVVKGQGHVWPSKFKGEGYGQGQTHWSHLRPGVQWICLRTNRYKNIKSPPVYQGELINHKHSSNKNESPQILPSLQCTFAEYEVHIKH